MAEVTDEVRLALKHIVENLKPVAERAPDVLVARDDFNSPLELAKKAYPASATVRQMKPLEQAATLGTILLKISLLQGAVEADFQERLGAAIAAEDERVQRQWDEFNRTGM